MEGREGGRMDERREKALSCDKSNVSAQQNLIYAN